MSLQELVDGIDKKGRAAIGAGWDSSSELNAPTNPIHSAIYAEFLAHVAKKSEFYKSIRMADDLRDVASHLSVIRTCFILLTLTFLAIIALFALLFLCHRCQRRRRHWAESRVCGDRGGEEANEGRRSPRRVTWEHQIDENQTSMTATGPSTTPDDLRRAGHTVSWGMAGRGRKGTCSSPNGIYYGRSQRPAMRRHSHAQAIMNYHRAVMACESRRVDDTSTASKLITTSSVDAEVTNSIENAIKYCTMPPIITTTSHAEANGSNQESDESPQ